MSEKTKICVESDEQGQFFVTCGLSFTRPRERAHLEVLDQVVEHSHAVGVVGTLYIDEGTDLGGLCKGCRPRRREREVSARRNGSTTKDPSSWSSTTERQRIRTHLETDVEPSRLDFELLLAHHVLLWPELVVFPVWCEEV